MGRVSRAGRNPPRDTKGNLESLAVCKSGLGPSSLLMSLPGPQAACLPGNSQPKAKSSKCPGPLSSLHEVPPHPLAAGHRP